MKDQIELLLINRDDFRVDGLCKLAISLYKYCDSGSLVGKEAVTLLMSKVAAHLLERDLTETDRALLIDTAEAMAWRVGSGQMAGAGRKKDPAVNLLRLMLRELMTPRPDDEPFTKEEQAKLRKATEALNVLLHPMTVRSPTELNGKSGKLSATVEPPKLPKDLGLASAFGYILTAILMTLTNKSLASSSSANLSPEFVLLIECIVTCFGLQLLYTIGMADRPRATLRMRLVWRYLVPVTLLKAGNMQLSFIAMKFTSLPIYNVLKRLTPLGALVTDWLLRSQKPHSKGVIFAVALLTLGSICAGLGDLDFDPFGYATALVAAACQSGYLVMAAKARDALSKDDLINTTTLLYYTALFNALLFFGPACLYELVSSPARIYTMIHQFDPHEITNLLLYCLLGALLNFMTFELK
ncbi:hypothetical protein FOL47_010999 [Perkinsus chesapeaki]|uniref:Sugar phosphate transporter domain-containing protein n=1 Tax=Perkinsus chesapeaki TaxID=330153 RepID=A0A7J6L1D4_PERCH|nr:hypothetical protein FOL47_010999 [Perkinsus chesapeaki]